MGTATKRTMSRERNCIKKLRKKWTNINGDRTKRVFKDIRKNQRRKKYDTNRRRKTR